jgi:hypothetical protein|tara:strand:- start:289 stop:564 length:276 start_codon:yes stop_codon:yes gene_type:complete
MSDKVELGEIVFCDLTIIHKGTKHKLEKVVYKNDGNLFYKRSYLEKLKIKEPVKVEDIKVISRLGFQKNNKGFTEVKGNDEKRNKITGAYE